MVNSNGNPNTHTTIKEKIDIVQIENEVQACIEWKGDSPKYEASMFKEVMAQINALIAVVETESREKIQEQTVNGFFKELELAIGKTWATVDTLRTLDAAKVTYLKKLSVNRVHEEKSGEVGATSGNHLNLSKEEE